MTNPQLIRCSNDLYLALLCCYSRGNDGNKGVIYSINMAPLSPGTANLGASISWPWCEWAQYELVALRPPDGLSFALVFFIGFMELHLLHKAVRGEAKMCTWNHNEEGGDILLTLSRG